MQNAADSLDQVLTGWIPRLRAIGETQASASDASSTWSPKQVLGHLIDSAANNHQRFVRMQADSRLELPGYDQQHWVRCQQYESENWDQLVDLWSAYNRHLVHVLRRVPPEAWTHECSIGGRAPLTLDFIAQDYVAHMKHHLEQIAARS